VRVSEIHPRVLRPRNGAVWGVLSATPVFSGEHGVCATPYDNPPSLIRETMCSGLLPIVQWLIALERSPPPTKYLQTIERLQGLTMLVYYPLEHLYYFASHSILPARLFPSPPTNAKIALWSCRAWATYVALQFLHLREDWKLLKLRERALRRNTGKQTGTGEAASTSLEHFEVAQRRRAIWNEFLVNVGYLPLTLHW
jgi:hypothetical protein